MTPLGGLGTTSIVGGIALRCRISERTLRPKIASATIGVPSARLDSLLAYVTADGRVCPVPSSWAKLHEMLGRRSPKIAILGGWLVVPAAFKMLILDAQIRYAADHGKLAQVDRFLRGLPDREWFRLGSWREEHRAEQLTLPYWSPRPRVPNLSLTGRGSDDRPRT